MYNIKMNIQTLEIFVLLPRTGFLHWACASRIKDFPKLLCSVNLFVRHLGSDMHLSVMYPIGS